MPIHKVNYLFSIGIWGKKKNLVVFLMFLYSLNQFLTVKYLKKPQFIQSLLSLPKDSRDPLQGKPGTLKIKKKQVLTLKSGCR